MRSSIKKMWRKYRTPQRMWRYEVWAVVWLISAVVVWMGWCGWTINGQPVARTGFYRISYPTKFLIGWKSLGLTTWSLKTQKECCVLSGNFIYTWLIEETSEEDIQEFSFTGTNPFIIFKWATVQRDSWSDQEGCYYLSSDRDLPEKVTAHVEGFGCVVDL